MFSSTKAGHLAHILATSLLGQVAGNELVPPDPDKIEQYGHLIIQALARWLGDPVLRLTGRPIITECYRSPERQEELYKQGRSKPGPIVTYKRGGESKHNKLPTPALDVAFILPDGEVSWSGLLLSKFARLMKAADARVRWGGDWPGFKDRPHFEV
ncbi:M15 family metallopeptidase [Hymenobacter glacialis]|uniref:Peptidase M15C domain-containing protein n=1 Tax=Hymenobacter glacialis TaxID=1908236 RepID=A0A1G1T670_9BACT|nr:M15 family metallopeptidase [Hymenobacter glacialis]OGX86373.1 hypothetical protein BEN48_12890 [Hymenobacter glacialis]